ncbi:unnamed protein product [Rotaria sp. Silwood1]|nr:unnamed protein product [Rotaria sp. Silwood1]
MTEEEKTSLAKEVQTLNEEIQQRREKILALNAKIADTIVSQDYEFTSTDGGKSGDFIKDTKSGCLVWNDVGPAMSVTWSGSCKDNYAEGEGTLSWFENNNIVATYIGQMQKGYVTGKGKYIYEGWGSAEGNFVNGTLQGQGKVLMLLGGKLEGNFVDGELLNLDAPYLSKLTKIDLGIEDTQEIYSGNGTLFYYALAPQNVKGVLVLMPSTGESAENNKKIYSELNDDELNEPHAQLKDENDFCKTKEDIAVHWQNIKNLTMDNPVSKYLAQQYEAMVEWVNGTVNSLSDEDLKMEVSLGKNHGIWLLGHLVVADDDFSLYMGKGELLYPEIYETFGYGNEGANVMLFEDGEWAWEPMDGTTPEEVLVRQYCEEGTPIVTATGNLSAARCVFDDSLKNKGKYSYTATAPGTAAEELGAAIFVHPWDMMGKKEMPKYWLPWLVGMPAETSRAICSMIFGGVFEKLKKLKVCFAHGGGSFPFTLGRIEHGFEVRPDLCAIDNNVNPKEYIGKFYLDSLTHDKDALKYIVNLMGENKICLGTDYPFPLGELTPGKLIEEMDFGNELKEKLLWKNAIEFLGVKLK